MERSAFVRQTSRLLRFVAPTALYLASCSAGFGAEAVAIGEPLPTGTEPSSLPAEFSRPAPPEWQSLAFGVPTKRIAETLSQGPPSEEIVITRGVRERSLYEKAAPSVVLVMTNDGFGSGSYIGSNQIITNWHVVRGVSEVAIIFWDREKAFRATVSKIDQERDLALLTVGFIPESISPLKLGNNAAVRVGDDVHAIGHPSGESWTYTKGFVSAIRPDYRWEVDGNAYSATVIQTQTPINPGSSGGPLLSDDAEILGVNTVSRSATQGLNFAVSVDDVRAFLDAPILPPGFGVATPSDQEAPCEAKKLFAGKGKIRGNKGHLEQWDTNCDGRADFSWFFPHSKHKAHLALIDTNYDGKSDIEVQDRNRDGNWDISYHDTNYDGRSDLVGHHPDGQLAASYFDKFADS